MAETILITGANRGIGLELARQYAAGGWRVLACCRKPEEAAELMSIAGEMAGRLTLHRLDVARPEQIRELQAQLSGQPIDILFNNAGISGGRQAFGEVEMDPWLEAFRVNAVGPLLMAQAFADQVAAGGRKLIAAMGTQLGSIGDNRSGGRYIYRSTKAALHMTMKSLAVDLRPRGIIAVVLHPGWVRTDLGGASAALSPAESAGKLRRVLDSLTPEDSGRFLTYLGEELPWKKTQGGPWHGPPCLFPGLLIRNLREIFLSPYLPISLFADDPHRGETAAAGAQVGDLPLVETGGHPENLGAIDVEAEIGLQRRAVGAGGLRGGDFPLHQRLGGGQGVETGAGDLAAEQHPPAAEAGYRLEHPLLPLLPDRFPVEIAEQMALRHRLGQHPDILRLQAQGGQRLRVAPENQPALVAQQAVDEGVGGEAEVACQIGGANPGHGRGFEIEVAVAVVDQIDPPPRREHPFLPRLQLSRVGDPRTRPPTPGKAPRRRPFPDRETAAPAPRRG